jgi:hypothetical protein
VAPVGTKVTITGTGLAASKAVSLVWMTANVRYILDAKPDSVDQRPEERGCSRDDGGGDRQRCRDSAGLQERERAEGHRAAQGEHLPSLSPTAVCAAHFRSFRLVRSQSPG